MKITFEKVTKNNLNQINVLANKVWPTTFNAILSDEQIAFMMQMMYSPSALLKQFENNCNFLILTIEQVPAGFASYEIGYQHNNQVVKLHKLYLLQEYQGLGLGKAFIDKIAVIGGKSNCTILSLNVNRYNKKAIDFYKRMEFEITKEEDIDIGNGYLMEDYVMEKKLN